MRGGFFKPPEIPGTPYIRRTARRSQAQGEDISIFWLCSGSPHRIPLFVCCSAPLFRGPNPIDGVVGVGLGQRAKRNPGMDAANFRGLENVRVDIILNIIEENLKSRIG